MQDKPNPNNKDFNESTVWNESLWKETESTRRYFVRGTHLDGMDKEDISQECYSLFVKALRTYDATRGTTFKTHYRNILQGWRANQYKKHTLTYIDDYDKLSENPSYKTPSFEDEVIAQELFNQLQKDEQRILELYFLEGKKMKEIAEILNLSLSTVERKKRKVLQLY